MNKHDTNIYMHLILLQLIVSCQMQLFSNKQMTGGVMLQKWVDYSVHCYNNIMIVDMEWERNDGPP